MADLEVHSKKHVRGFDERGQVSERDEPSFIKFQTSFRHGFLAALKGARLSVFICIALHDADETPGCSLSTICEETDYSKPSVIDALRYLSDTAHRFIEEAGLESDGTKNYRVVAFAWFGKSPKSNAGSGKKTLPPAVEKVFTSHVHDDVYIKHRHQEESSSIHERAEIEKILQEAFEGPNVQRLAARLDTPDLAQEWVDWCEDAATRETYRNPQGYAYKVLMEKQNARPPFVKAKAMTNERHPIIRGRLAREMGIEENAGDEHGA